MSHTLAASAEKSEICGLNEGTQEMVPLEDKVAAENITELMKLDETMAAMTEVKKRVRQ